MQEKTVLLLTASLCFINLRVIDAAHDYTIITVVTFYATLGEDAVVFGLNECGVTHLVTSMELLDTRLKVNYSLLSLITVSCTEMPHTQLVFVCSGCCLVCNSFPINSINMLYDVVLLLPCRMSFLKSLTWGTSFTWRTRTLSLQAIQRTFRFTVCSL